jgi:hypothetical protein
MWRLVEALLSNKDTDIVVFDDCSDYTVTQLPSTRVEYLRNQVHRGKSGFWRTYQDIFNYCKEHVYDYYIILPDDVIPCDCFIDKAIAAYNNALRCICMSPLLTNRSISPGISRC